MCVDAFFECLECLLELAAGEVSGTKGAPSKRPFFSAVPLTDQDQSLCQLQASFQLTAIVDTVP
jgi:hypothetical protein